MGPSRSNVVNNEVSTVAHRTMQLETSSVSVFRLWLTLSLQTDGGRRVACRNGGISHLLLHPRCTQLSRYFNVSTLAADLSRLVFRLFVFLFSFLLVPPMTTETLQDAQQQALEELSQEFLLSSQQLKDIAKHFKDEMEHGLQSDDASVPMLPSWITRHPTGQETGEYLGLEVSGKSSRDTLQGLKKKSTAQPTRSCRICRPHIPCRSSRPGKDQDQTPDQDSHSRRSEERTCISAHWFSRRLRRPLCCTFQHPRSSYGTRFCDLISSAADSTKPWICNSVDKGFRDIWRR